MGLKDKARAKAGFRLSEPFDVPTLGIQCRAFTLSGAQWKKYVNQSLAQNAPGKPRDVRGLQELLVAMGACDADGKRAFEDNDVEFIAENLPQEAIDAIADQVRTWNGMDDDGDEKKGDSTPKLSSSTSSPSPPAASTSH